MRLRSIILDREILEPVSEYARRPAKDAQFRRAFGNAPQLLFDEFGVIEIEMHVAAGPDDFMRGKIAHLRDHSRQQRRLEDVERKAEPKVARALEEQARQPAVAPHMELIGHMARRQRHAINVRSEERTSELQSHMS